MSTIIQKILADHSGKSKVAVGDYVVANIDIAMIPEGLREVHDTAVKEGLKDGLPKIWDPSKVVTFFDHVSPITSMKTANVAKASREITSSYGVSYYDINEGICHEVMPEKGHVWPGGLIVGKDSHSTTYGAFNAAGIPIGTSEMVYALVKGELWFRVPETIQFNLQGKLPPFVMAKDIFLHVAGKYSSEVAQYKSIEWRGDGASRLSIDGRMCISEASVELGAKCGIFEADATTLAWLSGRVKGTMCPVKADPDAEYEQTYNVNVSNLEPQVAKPHFVENVVPVTEVEGTKVDQAVIGSCANGRLEDLRIAANIMKGKKRNPDTRFYVTPASAEVARKAMDEGIIQVLIEAGALVTNPCCGTCTGFLGVLADGEKCIAATPRNFLGRMGSTKASIYLGSPATVAASAIKGEITDPRRI